jgi:hypothetical protein
MCPAHNYRTASWASCVTRSVTGRSEQDAQDTTGRDSIGYPYLAWSADFTAKFASSRTAPVTAFKTTAIDHSAIPPRAKSGLNSRCLAEHGLDSSASVTRSVTIATGRDTPRRDGRSATPCTTTPKS